MRCPNCGHDHWENVDAFRIKPSGMEMCTHCGFISYPSKWKTKEEILAHYRTAYRPPPTSNNLFTGERKAHFHHVFLLDLFEQWKKDGIEEPVICEVGAAFGYTLNWVRHLFPKAKIYGTEITTSMRRVCAHEFGIRLTEDIDESIQYDLIMSYKVLEHQLDPHLELQRYANLLKPGGKMYMSVPTWFDTMTNFGMAGFDLEYYYDPNHINVWTREMFEAMMRNNGFKILKSDYIIYGSTYLCEPFQHGETSQLHKENTDDIKDKLKRVKDAYMAFTENNFKKAIEIWPDYPHAHVQLAEMNRRELKEKGWQWTKENVLEKAIKECPFGADPFIMATDFAMRFEQWGEAIKYCEQALKAKPENPISLHHMMNIMREKALRGKTDEEKLHYFIQGREVAVHLRRVSAQHFREATDMIFQFDSHIPFKGESDPTQAPKIVKVPTSGQESKADGGKLVSKATPA